MLTLASSGLSRPDSRNSADQSLAALLRCKTSRFPAKFGPFPLACCKLLRSFSSRNHPSKQTRAGDGIRTHDNHVGNVVLYQLSYTRMHSSEQIVARSSSTNWPGRLLGSTIKYRSTCPRSRGRQPTFCGFGRDAPAGDASTSSKTSFPPYRPAAD